MYTVVIDEYQFNYFGSFQVNHHPYSSQQTQIGYLHLVWVMARLHQILLRQKIATIAFKIEVKGGFHYSAESLISLKKQKLMDAANTLETLPLDSNAIGTIQDAPLKSNDVNSTSRGARRDEAANKPVFSLFVGNSVSEVQTGISTAEMSALEEEMA